VAGSVGFAPHKVVSRPSRAEKGLTVGAGTYVIALLQNVVLPVQPPTVESEPRFMVVPPPVKFIAFAFLSFEAMPQLGAMIFGLPWKLIEGPELGPALNAKTQGGYSTLFIVATAVAPILTVDKPSTLARYAGCCWLTVA
jgi:hypothetical protein